MKTKDNNHYPIHPATLKTSWFSGGRSIKDILIKFHHDFLSLTKEEFLFLMENEDLSHYLDDDHVNKLINIYGLESA